MVDGFRSRNEEQVKSAVDGAEEYGAPPTDAPQPLFRPPGDPTPYPIESLGSVLAPAARGIMDIIQCPDALAAQSVLATASLAVQAHADVENPATRRTKPISLHMVTIADSGERKSASDSEANWPVQKRERALSAMYKEEMKEFLKQRKAWEAAQKRASRGGEFKATLNKFDAMGDEPTPPLMPMLTCPDPTIEGLAKLLDGGQASMGIFSDEGGLFIAGHGMSQDNRLRTAAGLSGLWDGTPIKRVRALDGSSIIEGKRVALHLMAQPNAAAQMLADPTLADQGFLSRLLVAAPASTAGTRFQREPRLDSRDAIKRYGARLLSILERPANLIENSRNELDPRTLTVDRLAVQAWKAFADRVEGELVSGGRFEPIRGFANKMPEHALRIAAVLALVDNVEASAISLPMFERGVTLTEYYAHEALRLFGSGNVRAELRRAEVLRLWLLSSWPEPAISVRAVVRCGPNSIRDTKSVRAAIEVLEEHGWLKRETGKVTVDGNPVREAWRIVRPAS